VELKCDRVKRDPYESKETNKRDIDESKEIKRRSEFPHGAKLRYDRLKSQKRRI